MKERYAHWERRCGRGRSGVILATLDLPRSYLGKLRPGEAPPHRDLLCASAAVSGIRLNLTKRWDPSDAEALIRHAHAHGKIAMADVVSRLRILSHDPGLLRVHRGAEIAVSLTGEPQGGTPLFFNRTVDPAFLRADQPVILRDRRGIGRVAAVDEPTGRIRIFVEETDVDPLELLDPPVNLPGYEGSFWQLTDQDRASIRLVVRTGTELLAVSFLDDPENAVAVAAEVAAAAQEEVATDVPLLVVKVENERGVMRLGEVLAALEPYAGGVAVEVARGDLANELALDRLGEAQEHCVRECRYRGIPVGIATGLLGSMQRSRYPTRAEAVDAWHAVRAGAAFLLLADETANDAEHPAAAIAMLAEVIARAEEHRARPAAVLPGLSPPGALLLPGDRHLFCLAGVPAVGKSTVRQALYEHYPRDVTFLRRWTTRALRPGEEGEIVQLSRAEFCAKVTARQLTAVFCANRAMYGVSVEELAELLCTECRCIGVISASAGLALRDRGYPVTVLYLTVRNRDVLVARLRERGHSDAEIAMRMHEYDNTDAEWREVSASNVLYTDELSAEETTDAVARILGLPAGASVTIASSAAGA